MSNTHDELIKIPKWFKEGFHQWKIEDEAKRLPLATVIKQDFAKNFPLRNVNEKHLNGVALRITKDLAGVVEKSKIHELMTNLEFCKDAILKTQTSCEKIEVELKKLMDQQPLPKSSTPRSKAAQSVQDKVIIEVQGTQAQDIQDTQSLKDDGVLNVFADTVIEHKQLTPSLSESEHVSSDVKKVPLQQDFSPNKDKDFMETQWAINMLQELQKMNGCIPLGHLPKINPNSAAPCKRKLIRLDKKRKRSDSVSPRISSNTKTANKSNKSNNSNKPNWFKHTGPFLQMNRGKIHARDSCAGCMVSSGSYELSSVNITPSEGNSKLACKFCFKL